MTDMTIRESVEAFLPWMTDHTDGWNIIDVKEAEEAFSDVGFRTEYRDGKYGKILVVTHPDHEGEMEFYTSNFKDRFERMKASGPFWLIDPEAGDEPEFRYMSNDNPVTTFDADGRPKVRKGASFYGVLNDARKVPWGDPWLKLEREMLSINGSGVASRLAHYLLGFSPGSKYMGRGFAQQADARAIHAFAKGEEVEE